MKVFHFILSCFTLFLFYKSTQGLHPIILVPGDGGSQIEAKLDKPSVVHYLCDKKTTDFFNIWLNLELLVPVIIDCWVDNVRLIYDNVTRTTKNSPGVEIRVPGYGNTTTVEYLDPSEASPGHYFKTIVENSLIPLGYNRNKDIHGAPYDFRKAPNEMSDWLKDFKILIEQTYESNGKSSVILICHSMGSPLSLYFLLSMTQAWKDKYIKALMTLGGVWGGSVKALKVFAVGDDLGSYVLPAKKLRGEQRTSPSTAFLLPSANFWKPDEVLVSVANKRNYTVNDFKDFFHDINFEVGYEMWKDTSALLPNLIHPGVEVHCLFGNGISSVESFSYKDESSFPEKPVIKYGNGDGTVNIRSLRGCLQWQNVDLESDWRYKKRESYLKKNIHSFEFKKELKILNSSMKKSKNNLPKVFVREFDNCEHLATLSDARVVAYIKDAIKKINLN